MRELGVKSIFIRGGTLPRIDRPYLVRYRKSGGKPQEKTLYTIKQLDKFISSLPEAYCYQLFIKTDGKLEQINYNKY